MSYSEKQRQYNDKYDAENMIAYTVKYKRSIYDAVEKAMEKSGMNRNKWTTTAIMEKLKRDGFLSEWWYYDYIAIYYRIVTNILRYVIFM